MSCALRKLAAMAAAALLSACGGTQKTPAAVEAQAQGLPVGRVFAQPTASPVVEIRVVFSAGSVDDPTGLSGLTYVTVGTMLEGGAGGIEYAERARRLFPMAATISGHVEREQVVFSARVHRDHLDAFYPLFRDVLAAPEFSETDFERVRARALASLTQDLRGADDEGLGKEVLQQMLYEGHPYGRPELGTATGLASLRAGHLREHYKRVLCVERLQVALTGGFDEAFTRRLTEDLGTLRSSLCTGQRALPDAPELSGRRVWIVDKPEAGAVAISMGFPTEVTRAHPDYAALTLVAAYLGQHRTFAGRLMQKMRADRGLNYGDYAYAEHFVQDGYSRFPLPNVARRQQYFSVWLRPVQPEQAHFALRMAVRELELFQRQGISRADFERIQRFLERYLVLYAQTAQQRLGYRLDDVFYGLEAGYLDRLRAQIRALTPEQVNAAVAQHFDLSRLQIAMVAPRAKEFAEALVKDEPSPIQYASEKPPDVLAEDEHIQAYPLGLKAEQITIIPVAKVFE
jgi:zinc protease